MMEKKTYPTVKKVTQVNVSRFRLVDWECYNCMTPNVSKIEIDKPTQVTNCMGCGAGFRLELDWSQSSPTSEVQG